MTFSARLKKARQYAGLSQAQLAEAVGISQSNISQLENSGNWSEFTVQLARSCGVNALWLATGEEPMISSYGDPRIAHVIGVMEKLPDIFRDEAKKEIDSLADLAERIGEKKD